MAQQKLGIEITGNAAGLTAALNTASGKLKAFGSKMQSVGGGLTRSLTLPLVAAGLASVKMAFDFDKSMTQIKALVGVAGDEVDAMGQRAKQMALDTGKSATEAGDALFYITSAGLRGEEAMQVLEASLKAAAVGLGETKTIADLATSAMNAYGSDTLSASGATDILTAAVREGKLEASALAGAMGGVIPIASNMGVGFDEVAAAMAAMSRTGTDAASGATQLNAILASIKKPTTEAELAFSRMGISAADVQKSLADQGLIATLVQLQEGLTKTGQDATAIFPNIRALKGFLDLTGAGLESNKEIFDALTKSMGATNTAFEETSKSASFKMTKSLNEMQGSLLEVGSVLLEMLVPLVTKLGTFLREASDAFNSLDEGTKKVILTFGGIVAVVGPALLVIGKISTTLGFLSASLPLLTTNWKLFSAALMANPIIAVATAVLALGVAIYSYTQAQKDALAEVNTIEEVESALAKKRIKFLEEQQILSNSVNTNKQYWAKKNMDALSDEIKALEDKRRALDAIRIAQEKAAADAAAAAAPTPTGGGTPTGGTAMPAITAISEGLQAFGAITLVDPTTALKDSVTTNAEQIKLAVGGFGDDFVRLQETAMLVGAEVSNAILGMSGSLIDSLGLAENGMQGFLGGLLKMAAQAISAFLGQAIAAAIAGANIAASFTAAAAIFTQPAFMATMVGGVLAAFAAIPKFADGGIVSGPTMGLMGEYPGARSNPEVIAPLNKLESMLGGRGATNVNVGGEFIMRGSDLVVVLDRANKNRNRLI
jgi:TP901 family phage tail tape measure protein